MNNFYRLSTVFKQQKIGKFQGVYKLSTESTAPTTNTTKYNIRKR